METFCVSYADGAAHAAEDVEWKGLLFGKGVAKSLINNPSFPEVYKQGYSTTISKLEKAGKI